MLVPRAYHPPRLPPTILDEPCAQVYKSPSVFSFFDYDYAPAGAVEQSQLVAPEAQLATLPYVIGFMDGVSTLVFDGLSACKGGFGTACGGGNIYPAPWWPDRDTDGYLTFTPTDMTSTNAIISELDLLLAGGRTDDNSRGIISAAYDAALSNSSCPNDRSAELCGRLTPGGPALHLGESITNAAGETLCFSYDGVAKHIGADGKEVFSTAFATRGVGHRLEYNDPTQSWFTYGQSPILVVKSQSNQWRWRSTFIRPGSRQAFHTFLAGPCDLIDASALERMSYGHTEASQNDVAVAQATCTAVDTCASYTAGTRTANYAAERAVTDAEYALKVAQNLFAASAAFATTNEPSARTSTVTPTVATSGATRPYKALVVLFMAGGADTFNLLIPHSNCNPTLETQYTQTRGAAAISLNTVLQISETSGTQPCSTFGLHPRMTTLQTLYNDGDASFTANVGSLVQPLTKADFIASIGQQPPALYAHNTQTKIAESVQTQAVSGAKGIAARIFDAYAAQVAGTTTVPLKGSAYSITASRALFYGSESGVNPILLSSAEGMLTYDGTTTADQAANNNEKTDFLATVQQLAEREVDSVFADAHNSATRDAIAESARVSAQISGVTLTQNWVTAANQGRSMDVARGEDFVNQLRQVSKVIASRAVMGAERDIFYVSLGGFDTHSNILSGTDSLFGTIDIGLDVFVREMKALGVWDSVALQAISEFGRTMTTNGQGTDHAWGGNYFLIGGDVRGGKVHGAFPELRVDGPNSISSTGPMLPTSSWESIWKPLAQWMGVDDAQLNTVMPNLPAFMGSPLMLTRADVFES